jgi:hypothetical protein
MIAPKKIGAEGPPARKPGGARPAHSATAKKTTQPIDISANGSCTEKYDTSEGKPF